ncbi:MAG: hypothetical protein H7343_19895, partial [Undibacterium sp.]|nr:hypothetical protein [Opitutaceae bacterium]
MNFSTLSARVFSGFRVAIFFPLVLALSLRAATTPDAPFTTQELSQGFTEGSLLAVP